MRLSRMATFGFAIVLFSLAVFSLHKAGRVVEVGLQIASVAYGALLGVFLLGVLTKRANQRGAMVGMLFGFSMDLYLWRWTHVPWTWWVMIGNDCDVWRRICSQHWYCRGVAFLRALCGFPLAATTANVYLHPSPMARSHTSSRTRP